MSELSTGTVKSSLKDELSKLCGVFKDSEWCNDCRDWYKGEECPDCKEERSRNKEIERLRAALDKVQDIAFRMIGHMWEEDAAKIESICREVDK